MDSPQELPFSLLLLIIGFFALFSIVRWSLKNGISPMPTSSKAKRCLLEALPPSIEGNVYELGSGWGLLLSPLAKHYSGCQIIGYETSPLPYWFSRVRYFFCKCPNVKVLSEDFFSVSLADASLIVCYLYPGAMQRLKEKLSQELKPGTWVISNTFSIPGWQVSDLREVNDLYYTKIYLYRMPQDDTIL